VQEKPVAVKLIDLQLIYGVAGAREHFDDLASQLVMGELDGAKKIQVKRGDGGIDIYHGDVTDPSGIDIYQCKFFPQGLGKSQKAQIDKSFRTCADSDKFHAKSWTLCLPVNLGIEETTWFEEWRKDQADTKIQINDPWAATKLEGLLYLDKNKGLKEEYFKEEHLRQIREVHGMLTELIASMAKRLDDEAGGRRILELLERQHKYLKAFHEAARRDFKFLAHTNLGAFWDCMIRPVQLPETPVLDSLQKCRGLVSHCQMGPTSEPFPEISCSEQISGHDYTGANVKVVRYECWRMSQFGVFINMFMIGDDQPINTYEPLSFSVDAMVFRLTQLFRFAERFATRLSLPALRINIRLAGIENRALRVDRAIMRALYKCEVPELENHWEFTTDQLKTPDQCALQTAFWFCERFNWSHVSIPKLAIVQKEVAKHIWKSDF
jgi:hypothetical protein